MNGHPRLTNERYANHESTKATLGKSPNDSATAATTPTIHTAVIISSLLFHQNALGCCQKLCSARLAEATSTAIGDTPLAPKSPFACAPKDANATSNTPPNTRPNAQDEIRKGTRAPLASGVISATCEAYREKSKRRPIFAVCPVTS